MRQYHITELISESFGVDHMLVSPCGVDCEGCEFGESCGGSCFACEGKPFYLADFGVEVCPMYDCSVNQKSFKTCGECADLPCQVFYDWKDPSMTEEAHLQSIKDRVEVLKAL